MKNDLIKNIVDNIIDEIISHRRNLHKIPELGNEEYKTKEYIIQFLKNNNIEYKEVLETGIHAVIRNGNNKSMAFRADMDGLPIFEDNNLSFKSINEGKMHACGHDIHMSVQMGIIKALSNNKELWKGTAHFFFQPAEETVGGAKRMLEAGVNSEKIDRILAFHSAPEIKTSKIGIRYGKLHATSAVFKLEIIGKTSHAALAYQGIDAILVASNVVNYLQSIVSRRLDARNSGVITVGTFNSGSAENVVSDKAILTGTIRTLDQETKRKILDIFNNELVNFVESYGAKINIHIRDSYAPVINDEEFTKFFEENTKSILPQDSVIHIEETRMDVEDMGFFLEEIKGTFYRLGVANDDNINSELHNANFIANEKSIYYGLLASLKTAMEYLC